MFVGASEVLRRPSKSRRKWVAFAGSAAAVLCGVGAWGFVGTTGSAEITTAPEPETGVFLTVEMEAPEEKWLEIAPTKDAVPTGLEIGLANWTHPLADPDIRVPTKSTRRFGARRDGDRPSECRRGHCGVDLASARGTPVVAVADGIIIRVDTRAERLSGKYVKIRHDVTGYETEYMHLDDLTDGLRAGQSVRAGQLLGSLGKTGIKRSVPHLHFAVTMPVGAGRTRYVDPTPALEHAQVLGVLDIGVPHTPPAKAAIEQARQSTPPRS